MPALEAMRAAEGQPMRGQPGSGDVADADMVTLDDEEWAALGERTARWVNAEDEDAPGFDCEAAWPRCYGGTESW